MARNAPTKTIITATFTDLISDINDISFDLGATGRLTTNQDSDVVGAINELKLGISGTSNNLVATDLADFTADNIVSALHELDSDMHGAGGGNAKADLTTDAKNIVAAINEIEAVFDASTYEITAGSNQFDVTSGDFNVNATGDITLDASGDIILDGDDADVLLKDAGTQYGALTNTSGNLIVKSGTTTALTFSGANVTTAGSITLGNANIIRTGSVVVDATANITLDADGGNVYLKDGGTQYGALTASGSNLIVKSGSTTAVTFDGDKATFSGPIYADSSMGTLDQTVVGAINELHDSLGDATLTTTATQVKEAINEHETDIGDMTFTGLSATNISAAIRELRTELGNHSTLTTTATSNTVAAINELDALQGNSALGTTATTITGAIAELDSDRDDLITFAAPNTGLTTTATTLPGAINEHETDIGDMTFTGLSATNISAAIRELRTELGNHTSLNTTVTTNTVSAINELHTTLGDAHVDSNGVNNNLSSNNIGESLVRIDDFLGDRATLNTDNINDTTNIVTSLNSLGSAIALLDSDGVAVNQALGLLEDLDAAFVGSERDNFVAALNAMRADVPLIYDENGTQLN